MIVDRTVVNAFAFTGGNYLFFLLGNSGETDVDMVIEQLWCAEAENRDKRQLCLDYINQQNRVQQQSTAVFEDRSRGSARRDITIHGTL